MLGIKHSYHSHISNEVVMQRANQIIRLTEGRTITKMSGKLVNRHTIHVTPFGGRSKRYHENLHCGP